MKTFQDKMESGDLVVYLADGNSAHTAIYAGISQMKNDKVDFPRITCHTYCRYPTDDCNWNDCHWDLA